MLPNKPTLLTNSKPQPPQSQTHNPNTKIQTLKPTPNLTKHRTNTTPRQHHSPPHQHRTPKIPQKSAIPVKTRPIFGTQPSSNRRRFTCPTYGASTVQYPAPKKQNVPNKNRPLMARFSHLRKPKTNRILRTIIKTEQYTFSSHHSQPLPAQERHHPV